MDTSIYIIIAIFAVSAVAAITTMYIRKYGKDNQIETKDLETGVNVAKDAAIEELEKKKSNGKQIK